MGPPGKPPFRGSPLPRGSLAAVVLQAGHAVEGPPAPNDEVWNVIRRAIAKIKGVPMDDVWDIGRVPPVKQLYPTQKPEALLERIIGASSNEGDTVLDAYCGCGTTVAVAQNLKRNWIGIDITYQSISLILFIASFVIRKIFLRASMESLCCSSPDCTT